MRAFIQRNLQRGKVAGRLATALLVFLLLVLAASVFHGIRQMASS